MIGTSRGRGFTLIELLIVVAIIAILALIAVPNFLEAQVRAKVSRSKNDQRTIHLGVESLRVDWGVLLVDFWDDDNPTIVTNRLQQLFGCRYQARDQRGGPIGVLVPLTTPIAYLSSLPLDVFATDYNATAYIPNLVEGDRKGPFSFMYIDNDSEITGDDHGMDYYKAPPIMTWRQYGTRYLEEGQFLTMGLGPTKQATYEQAGIYYDPTNGTASAGMIVRHSADPK